MKTYVLDACAMLAVLSDEPGAEVIEEIYERANFGEIVLTMNKINLLEVYYDLIRSYGKSRANEVISEIRQLPIVNTHPPAHHRQNRRFFTKLAVLCFAKFIINLFYNILCIFVEDM